MKRFLSLLVLLISITGFGQGLLPQSKYSPINGQGFIYKRMMRDSVDGIPLSTSPHIPYRAGGIRYNILCECLELWNGVEWKKDLRAIQLTDSSFQIGDSVITIRTGGESKDIDVFLVAGQSNAKGKGDSLLSPRAISGKVLQINTGVITDANDPVGQDVPGSNERSQYGSAWPSFGNTYYNRTSRAICMVPSYKGGTSQTSAADVGAGNWDTTGVLFDSAVARVISAMSVLTAKGYNPIFKGVMWLQGESDAIGIQNGLITQTDYINAFTKMLRKFRQNFGASMPFYIIRIGTSTTYDDTYWKQIRDAQQSVANNDSMTQIVYYNAANFITRGLMLDAVHFNQVALNEVGQMSANAVLTHDKNIWQPQDDDTYFPNSGTVAIGGPPTESFNLEINTSKNTSAAGIKILNTNTGSGAFSTIRFYNNSGPLGYLYTTNSAAASYRPNAFTMFGGSTGGIVLSASAGDIIFSRLAQGTDGSTYGRYVRATNNYLFNTDTDNGANGKFQINSTSWFNGLMKIHGVTAPAGDYNLLVHSKTDSGVYQIPASLFGGETLGQTLDLGNTTNPGQAIVFTPSSGTNRNIQLSNPNSGVDDFSVLNAYPSTGTNVGSALAVIPRGTGFSSTIKAQLSVFNTDFVSDATNYEALVMRSTGTTGYTFNSLKAGTGTVRDIIFQTDGTDRLNITAAGTVQITGNATVADNAYDPTSWNGNSEVPTKNAIRDKIENIAHPLDAKYTTAGNTGTSETDLFSYTLPADKLAADGRTVNFEIDGEFNDNTITAQLRLYFAGNVTLNTGAVSVSTAFTKWKLTGYVMRTSSSTAHVTYELQCPGLATTVFLGYSNLTSLDFTTTNVFKISAQAAGGGASNSDITAHSWQLLYKPQPQ